MLLYNGEDELVGLRSSYTKPTTIAAGAEARFLAKVRPASEGEVRVEVQVAGSAESS